MCPVKNVNFSKGRGALKNAIFVDNGQRPNWTRYSSTNDRYATTLVNDIREKSLL